MMSFVLRFLKLNENRGTLKIIIQFYKSTLTVSWTLSENSENSLCTFQWRHKSKWKHLLAINTMCYHFPGGGSAHQGVLCAASHKATDHKILTCLVVDELTHSCSQWLCAVSSRRAGALRVLWTSAPIQISIDSELRCIMFHL